VNDVSDHADQWERSRDHRQLATRSRIRDHSIELNVIISVAHYYRCHCGPHWR